MKLGTVTAHQEFLHCARARGPRQSQTSVHKPVTERLPRELQLYSWRNKGFSDFTKEVYKCGASEPTLSKNYIRLQVYTNAIKTVNLNCKVFSKNKIMVTSD